MPSLDRVCQTEILPTTNEGYMIIIADIAGQAFGESFEAYTAWIGDDFLASLEASRIDCLLLPLRNV